jgi:hypothetical protein
MVFWAKAVVKKILEASKKIKILMQ